MTKNDYSRNTELILAAQQGDKSAFDQVVTDNLGLVRSLAHRFRERGVEYDDLIQIGTVGMIKAVRSFDPSFGTVFSTYAVPMIMGEIKRFIRDDSILKVSRDTKKLSSQINRQRELYIEAHGSEPQTSVLAQLCGLSVEELIFAMDASAPVRSLNAPANADEDSSPLEDFIGDDQLEEITTSLSLREALGSLPEQQRQIIVLRYFRGMSQTQVATMLGLTQVKVSREERRIFALLRQSLG